MIEKITFEDILPIWRDYLWPDRNSEITATSAMTYLGGHDLVNMQSEPTFFAYMIDNEIAGVNSGHMTMDNSYRSRGLFVLDTYRGKSIGTLLLKATIDQAKLESTSMCWSYPRKSSWKSYLAAGFELASDWGTCETSDSNAYCVIRF